MPGFQEFAKLVITELFMTDVTMYSDSLKKVVVEFMANPKMLTPVMQIVYKKTSAHNYFAVFKTMDMTASWFARIEHNECIVSSCFPVEFFHTAVGILIDLDHSCSTAKVIWLLYQIMHVLPIVESDFFFLKLLEPKQFYSLLFHWSWHVRMCFGYFYFFQASRLLMENAGASLSQ